jgi:hypothetical protein
MLQLRNIMKKLIMFLMLLFSVFSFAQTTKIYYTCPMHAEVMSSKPGDCPKCGMSLVKKMLIMKPKVTSKAETKPISKTVTKATEPKIQSPKPKVKVEDKSKPRIKPEVKAKIQPKAKEVQGKKLNENGKSKSMAQSQSTAQSQAKYTCPMHPEVVSSQPGKCSKCGMDLVETERHQPKTENSEKEVQSVFKKNTENGKISFGGKTVRYDLYVKRYHCEFYRKKQTGNCGQRKAPGSDFVLYGRRYCGNLSSQHAERKHRISLARCDAAQ